MATATIVAAPMIAAAAGKPISPIATTQSGEKMSPAKLAPLYAVPSAAGRARTNQGAITVFTGTAPIAAQPAPLTAVAANNCHGSDATAHPTTPNERRIDPAIVTTGRPKRR